jgi:hypothetical protein
MLRGKSGLSSAAVLLVILALTGKLAFLTLSKKQLQSTNAAVSLLQVSLSAHSWSRWSRSPFQVAHLCVCVPAA